MENVEKMEPAHWSGEDSNPLNTTRRVAVQYKPKQRAYSLDKRYPWNPITNGNSIDRTGWRRIFTWLASNVVASFILEQNMVIDRIGIPGRGDIPTALRIAYCIRTDIETTTTVPDAAVPGTARKSTLRRIVAQQKQGYPQTRETSDFRN